MPATTASPRSRTRPAVSRPPSLRRRGAPRRSRTGHGPRPVRAPPGRRPRLRLPAAPGPGDRRCPARGGRPAGRRAAADRRGELHLARRARRPRLPARQQVRRGIPGRPAPRRLRDSSTSPSGSPSNAPRPCSAPNTPTSRPTPGLRPSWPPTPPCCAPETPSWPCPSRTAATSRTVARQLLRPLVRLRRLRRRRGDRPPRLRRDPRPGPGTPAQGHRLRLDLLSPAHRLRRVPRYRRRDRRLSDRGRRPPDRAGRRGSGAQPRPVRATWCAPPPTRCCAGPRGGMILCGREAGRADRPGGVPLHPGRRPDERRRRQGRRLRGGRHARVQRVRPSGHRQCPRPRRGAGRTGADDHHRRHRHPPDHRRPRPARAGRAAPPAAGWPPPGSCWTPARCRAPTPRATPRHAGPVSGWARRR